MKLTSRRKIALASSVLISAFAATVTMQSSAKAADCGTWGIAMHAWNGYTASAQVVTEVAKAFVTEQRKKFYLASVYPTMKLSDIEVLSQTVTDEEIKEYERDRGNS